MPTIVEKTAAVCLSMEDNKKENSFALWFCVQLTQHRRDVTNQIKDDTKHIARELEFWADDVWQDHAHKWKLPSTMRNNKLFIKLLSSGKHESENDIKPRINLLCRSTKRLRITERNTQAYSRGS